MLELFDTEDRVAEDVVQAHARLEAAAEQVGKAEADVREANITFVGNIRGISETRGAGDLLELVNRPQEAVAALQELNRTYDEYFAAVNGYNRAQFQLYRAMGYPARILVCDRPLGELQNVDLSRPASMAPVCPQVIAPPLPISRLAGGVMRLLAAFSPLRSAKNSSTPTSPFLNAAHG